MMNHSLIGLYLADEHKMLSFAYVNVHNEFDELCATFFANTLEDAKKIAQNWIESVCPNAAR